MYYTDINSVTPEKVYTIKELILIETLVPYFHKKNYIPGIQKLEFNLPHMHIIGTYHYG